MDRCNVLRPVLVDIAWPTTGLRRSAVLVSAGAVLISLLAQLKVPLWPVPVTGQTFGVLLVGAALGSRLGAITALTYIAWGALGFPVFAAGGAGPASLFGPTGGYLLGFVAAAFVVGRLCERGWDRRILTTAAAMLLGSAVIYLTGILWLSRFVEWNRVLELGVLPFLVGDLLKAGMAGLALPVAWKLTDPTRKHENR